MHEKNNILLNVPTKSRKMSMKRQKNICNNVDIFVTIW